MAWLIGGLCCMAVVALAWWWQRGSKSRGVQQVLRDTTSLAGPALCESAISCLQMAAAAGNSKLVVKVWTALEGPLLAALPDCPPDRKSSLADALEACHAVCRHRAVQRSMMELARSLRL